MKPLEDLQLRIMKELTSPGSFRWDVRESYASIAEKIGVDEETVRRRVKLECESALQKQKAEEGEICDKTAVRLPELVRTHVFASVVRRTDFVDCFILESQQLPPRCMVCLVAGVQ